MALLKNTPIRARRPVGTLHVNHPRPAAGFLAAAAQLAVLTFSLDFFNTGLSVFTKILCYLIVVTITGLVGGAYPAVTTATAATILVDYFVVPPIYELTPVQPDNVVFFVAALGVTVLSAALIGSPRHGRDVTDAVDQTLRETAGARQWAAVYTTNDGEYAIHAPCQDPLIAAQQLADGVHGFTCPGCERCRSAAA